MYMINIYKIVFLSKLQNEIMQLNKKKSIFKIRLFSIDSEQ